MEESLMPHVFSWVPTHIWEMIGYFGTMLFASRFFVQWFKSEMVGRSIIPVAFWYFSLAGGLISLAYAIHIESGPFIVGQAGGLVVYFRNLYLIFRENRRGSLAI
jgi:lipid-A-disaccharide synthase-like uncharacterized protein